MIITGGKYKGHKITAPDKSIARPTLSKVRMGFFNTLYSMLGEFEGKSFLDVFGGSGIMGLEALSRGFLNVTVFEINKTAAEIIKKNYTNLNLKPDLKIGDSTKLIKKIDRAYDVIYIDPPYENENYYNIINDIMLKNDAIIAAEHNKDILFENLNLIKTKNYGGKKISFYNRI